MNFRVVKINLIETLFQAETIHYEEESISMFEYKKNLDNEIIK